MGTTPNISNLSMGICTLTFNGQQLGHTLGGVKVQITRKLTDLKADKYGDSPIDKVLTDVEVKVNTKVAEAVIDQLKVAMPEAAYNVNGTTEQLGVAAGEGTSMRASAAQLVLHPASRVATDFSRDFTIYLAVATSSPVINYEVAGQQVFDLEFDALVSEAYTAGKRLGHFGPANIS